MRALFLLLAAFAAPLAAEDLPAIYSVTGVAANDVLNIRAAPDSAARIIGSFSPDATGIEVIAESDGWASVNSGEGLGYVAARFLRAEAGSPWYRLDRPISCFGTEPFWSFDIDGRQMTTSFASAGAADPVSRPVLGLWAGEAWAPTAAVKIAEGMAVLRPASCSDGMSDRGYGIAIDLFLNGGDHRISGCCTLVSDLGDE